MSNSESTNGVSTQSASPEAQTGALGFETMPSHDAVVRGLSEIDNELSWLLHENPADGTDPEMHSLAVGASALWQELREESFRGRPLFQQSKPDEPRTIRFAYLDHAPAHSLSFIVYPGPMFDYKLVLNGHIQCYEVSGANAPARAAQLLQRFNNGVAAADAVGSMPMSAGPPNLVVKPLYRAVNDALDIDEFYEGSIESSDSSATALEISTALSITSMRCNPEFGGTAEAHAVIKRAVLLWDDHYLWSRAREVPHLMITAEGHVYFGYKHCFPSHTFEIMIRRRSVSWCLLINREVVSFETDGNLGDTIARMQRFSLAAYDVSFKSPMSLSRKALIEQLAEEGAEPEVDE